MDPFRIGFMIVGVSGAVLILSVALPLIVQTLLNIVPGILVLALVYWVLRAMVGKLLS